MPRISPNQPDIERFMSHIEKRENGCWHWLSYKGKRANGYAIFHIIREDGKLGVEYVHRWAYKYFRGAIPESLQIDHLCRNRSCANPDHLEVVTHRENDLRGISFSAINSQKTYCPQGHPYDEKNTHITTKRFGRRCRMCNRDRSRVFRKQKREARASRGS